MTPVTTALAVVALCVLVGGVQGYRAFRRAARHHAINRELQQCRTPEVAELRATLDRRYGR